MPKPIPSLEQEAEAVLRSVGYTNEKLKAAIVQAFTRQRAGADNLTATWKSNALLAAEQVKKLESLLIQERHATAWRCIDLITHHVNGRGSLREQFTESIRAEFGLTE